MYCLHCMGKGKSISFLVKYQQKPENTITKIHNNHHVKMHEGHEILVNPTKY